MKLRKTGELSTTQLFCAISLVCFLILFLCFLFSRGELISRYFFYDIRDTGMDFFHSIEYVRGRAPYDFFNTLYPPLANLMFYFIYRLVPQSVSNAWAPSFREGIAARGTNIDLRTYQSPMLMFILVVAVAVWMMISLTLIILQNHSRVEANWIALCMLISPGMMYAFERGNILFVIVPLLLFFIRYRNSQNCVLRELALLSLAIAAGLKLYPAFFGVLLLRDKQYKEAVRAIIYGILSVILPMLFFKEGIAGIITWLRIVFRFGKKSLTPWVGFGFANILHRMAAYLERFLGVEVYTDWFAPSGYILAGILLLFAVFSRKLWQSILLIVMAITMYQSQAAYVFSLMCIPMIFFLEEERKLTLHNCMPFFLMTALLVNLPLFHTVYSGAYISAPDIVLKQGLCLLLICWCIIEPLVDWRKRNEMEK